MEDEFDILTAKVLGGGASPAERSRLEQILAENPTHREKYAQLQLAWKSLEAAGPLAVAMDAAPTPIPAHRLQQLQQRVRASSRTAHQAVSPADAAAGKSESAEVTTLFGLARRWLQLRTGLVKSLAAAVTLILVVFLTFRFTHPGREPVRQVAGGAPAAYLVIERGSARLTHNSTTRSAQSGEGLQPSDEIEVSPGSRVAVLGPAGVRSVNGPVRVIVSSLSSRVESSAAEAAPGAVKAALLRPAAEVASLGLLVSTRGGQTLTLYSPVGATIHPRPLIVWKSVPAKTYDVIITDELNPAAAAWRANGVVSPLDFARISGGQERPLAEGGLYRIHVQEAGNLLAFTERTFQVVNPAPSSAEAQDKLLAAHEILATAPDRLGDALVALLTLPKDVENSPLALRLKLLAFGQLGDEESYAAALARLQSLK